MLCFSVVVVSLCLGFKVCLVSQRRTQDFNIGYWLSTDLSVCNVSTHWHLSQDLLWKAADATHVHYRGG